MDKLRKEALQVTKEIVVKFIETQRISPSAFKDVFPQVYRVVLESIATDGSPESLHQQEPAGSANPSDRSKE